MGTVTRTVAFTDLANYTQRVSRSDREGLRKILTDHESLVQPIVERHGGRIVKNLGDSFMVLFFAATDALRAGLEIQHMVTGTKVSGLGVISIRLAMTTGDVEEIEGDAFGESVNLAARVLAQTPAGEVWFGPGTRVCMNAAEIPWESVGRFRLKGIPGEKEIFRAVPKNRAWLAEPIIHAARKANLVRLKRGVRPPLLPPDPVVLLEGFAPGSPALMEAVDALPVLNPASLWLAAYNIAGEDRNAWTESGRGLVIGTPEAIDQAIDDALRVSTNRSSGSDTIVLDVGVQADLELVMCGLALPGVPLSDVVSSYFYDLLPDGRWVNRSDRSLLRVEVTPQATRLQALATGILVNGRAVASGEGVDLADNDEIRTPSGSLRFEAANHGYAGLLLADTEMRLGVMNGMTAELGREPNHPGLAFPDRRGQDNIRWCPGPRAAKARAHGFTLDRALAGRRQAAIAVNGELVKLTPLHERCATYVLRQGTKGPAVKRVFARGHFCQSGEGARMNGYAIRAIYTFEMARTFRTLMQSIASPVLSTSLYFVVFGAAIGARMGDIEGVSYGAFIIPGLIMLALLNESISNASFGIYMPKWSGTIYELLSAPVSFVEVVIGYVGAAATKSVILGVLILATARLFVDYQIAHPLWMICFLALTAVTFSLFGFIIGIWADGFEKLQIIPLMIVTPLTFLGGSFYSISMLPPVWQKITLFNPVVYLISGFRWSFYGIADVSVAVSLGATLAFMGACLAAVWWIFRTGYHLKN